MGKRFLYTAMVIVALAARGYAQFQTPAAWSSGRGGGSQGHWIADVNGDGRADYLNRTSGGTWFVALSTGKGFGAETQCGTALFTGADRCLAGDFNGDGLCDLAGYDATAGTWSVAAMYQDRTNKDAALNGLYHFHAPVVWSAGRSSGSQGYWAGDFNGDGLDDIVHQRSGGIWAVALSTGTGFGAETQWGTPMLADADRWYAADFTGDGLTDIAGFFQATGTWKIAAAEFAGGTYRFKPPVVWAADPGAGSQVHVIGDANGDGAADIVNVKAGGTLSVALSQRSGFGAETQWGGSLSPGIGLWYAADVNGDGYCDAAGFPNDGTCLAALNGSKKPTIVAAWFSAWYTKDDTASAVNFWNHSMRDGAKIPITGSGRDTLMGIYNSADPSTLRRQINAMRASGIDLIIVDFTNGFYRDYDAGTKRVRAAADSMFRVMSSLPEKDQVKIAVAVGMEFWGPNHTPKPWPGWQEMKRRQRTSFDRIMNEYAARYPRIYFQYRGRPLVPIYITDGTDVPLKETTGVAVPLWHDNRFTIKNVVGWDATWSYVQKNNGYFHNGLDNNFNGWSWGSLYGGTNNAPVLPSNIPGFDRTDPPLPYGAECMGIMPGTYNHWNKSVTSHVARSYGNAEKISGEYYIRSWKEIIKNKPLIAMITDWNNWNEETAIEQCTGWKDYYGEMQPDWYLQITKAYAQIFKTGVIPDSTYVKEENDAPFYVYDGGSLVLQSALPQKKPVIMLPQGWFARSGIRVGSAVDAEFPKIR